MNNAFRYIRDRVRALGRKAAQSPLILSPEPVEGSKDLSLSKDDDA